MNKATENPMTIHILRATAIAKIEDLHLFALHIHDCFMDMNIYADDFSTFVQNTCDYLYEVTH